MGALRLAGAVGTVAKDCLPLMCVGLRTLTARRAPRPMGGPRAQSTCALRTPCARSTALACPSQAGFLAVGASGACLSTCIFALPLLSTLGGLTRDNLVGKLLSLARVLQLECVPRHVGLATEPIPNCQRIFRYLG